MRHNLGSLMDKMRSIWTQHERPGTQEESLKYAITSSKSRAAGV